MTEEIKQEEPTVKKAGRPKGSKDGVKRKYVRKADKAVAPTVPLMGPIPCSPITVDLFELEALATYIDYWKREAGLSTLQCLALYAR
jgi:hypothetical protein